MTQSYYLEAPNTCGLLFDTTSSVIGPYVEAPVGAEILTQDKFDEFFQFSSKEACLNKAISLDPSYSKNKIFGPIPLDKVDSSPDNLEGYVNQEIIIYCDFVSGTSDVLISYQWLDPQGVPIPTANTNVLTFTPSSIAFSGKYTCLVSAIGEYNWTGSDAFSCQVKIVQPLSF